MAVVFNFELDTNELENPAALSDYRVAFRVCIGRTVQKQAAASDFSGVAFERLRKDLCAKTQMGVSNIGDPNIVP